MPFAARYPDLVKSLSVVSSPVSLKKSLGGSIAGWAKMIPSEGVRAWANSTMKGRLGSDSPPEALAWWADMMGATAPSTVVGIMRTLEQVDVTDDLEKIQCLTLVITTTGSALGSVDAVKDWQRRIPHSKLLAFEDDSYHIAASKPDQCALAVLAFIRSIDGL